MTKRESDALVASKVVQEGFARLRQGGAKPSTMIVDDYDGGFCIKLSVELGTCPEYFGTLITTLRQAEQFLETVLSSIAEQAAGEETGCIQDVQRRADAAWNTGRTAPQ